MTRFLISMNGKFVRTKISKKKKFTDRIRTTTDIGLKRGNKYTIYTRVYYTERVRITVGPATVVVAAGELGI